MRTTPRKKNPWFTVREIAERYNISESLVRKMIRERKVRHYRVGRKILIKPKDFEAAMELVETFDELVDSFI
ncbi:MAG: helix-turn-helix domain-containing protein [Fidelibacterota bacterium]